MNEKKFLAHPEETEHHSSAAVFKETAALFPLAKNAHYRILIERPPPRMICNSTYTSFLSGAVKVLLPL